MSFQKCHTTLLRKWLHLFGWMSSILDETKWNLLMFISFYLPWCTWLSTIIRFNSIDISDTKKKKEYLYTFSVLFLRNTNTISKQYVEIFNLLFSFMVPVMKCHILWFSIASPSQPQRKAWCSRFIQ